MSLFDFFKQSIEKQLSMRRVIREIIDETNKHMLKYDLSRNQGRESSNEFVRPYAKRFEFDSINCGLMMDISFEIFVFFRNFYNPDLEGFSSLNLH